MEDNLFALIEEKKENEKILNLELGKETSYKVSDIVLIPTLLVGVTAAIMFRNPNLPHSKLILEFISIASGAFSLKQFFSQTLELRQTNKIVKNLKEKKTFMDKKINELEGKVNLLKKDLNSHHQNC